MTIHGEVLREVWRIVERKDGAVYRTEFIEERWIPVVEAFHSGRPDNDPDLIWVSSSKDKTHRVVKEDENGTVEEEH